MLFFHFGDMYVSHVRIEHCDQLVYKNIETAWPLLFQFVHAKLGPVHTMPDKFENTTLLLRIRLPSTLIRIKRSTKTELFENALQSGTIWKQYFFVLMWTENFLYPQLFEYADIILSCNLSSQVINMAKNMIFWNFESKQPPKTL